MSFGVFVYLAIKKYYENCEIKQTKVHSIPMSHLIDPFDDVGGCHLDIVLDFVVTSMKSRKNILMLRGKIINKTKRIIDYLSFTLILSDKSGSQKYNIVPGIRWNIPGSDCWDFNMGIEKFYGNPEDIICVHLKVFKLKFVDMNKPVLE